MQHTFVTVVFEGDVDLMRLQARSMDHYCPRELVERIIVIDNPSPGVEVDWHDVLLKEYGFLADKVEFIHSVELALRSPLPGWWTQQALKLLVAERVNNTRYTVLDAKNHLVFPLEESFLTAPGGKATIRAHGYAADHPLLPQLRSTMTYMGIDPEPYISLFFPTTTPFTIFREYAIEAMAFVGKKEGKSLVEAMKDKNLTEFFLYASWLLASGRKFKDLYELTQRESPVVWSHMADTAALLSLVDKSEINQSPFFSVHRATPAKMDAIGREVIAQFWRRRGLFQTTAEGFVFLGGRH